MDPTDAHRSVPLAKNVVIWDIRPIEKTEQDNHSLSTFPVFETAHDLLALRFWHEGPP